MTKVLGVRGLRLAPNMSDKGTAQLISDWSDLANQLALIVSVPRGVTHPPHRCPKNTGILTNSSLRTLFSWCCEKTGGLRRRAERIVCSMLQLKRSFPELPESMAVDALKKHRQLICSVPTKIFGELPYDIVDDILESYFPRGWAKRLNVFPRETLWSSTQSRRLEVLSSLKNRATLDGHTVRNPSGSCEVDYPTLMRSSAFPMLKYFSEREYDRWYQEATSDQMVYDVKACAVPDAGKFRIITKSDRRVKVLQPLQRALHSHLGTFPEFRFTAEQVDVNTFGALTGLKCRPGERFLSVDYTSATDSVHGEWMSSLIERILDRSGVLELQALSKIAVGELALGRRIIYAHPLAPLGSEIHDFQRRGSLMGSLLSFPLLCLWNASILRRSLGHDRFVVNGDDALACASEAAYGDWRRYAQQIGVSPSPGKVYWSEGLVTFCSQYWRTHRGVLRPIPWVPVSLMFAEMDGERYNRIPDIHKPFYKRFCSYNRNEWRPLLGPRPLGGLGGHASPQVPFRHRDISALKRANCSLQGQATVPVHVARALGLDVQPDGGMNNAASWLRPSAVPPPNRVVPRRFSRKFVKANFKEPSWVWRCLSVPLVLEKTEYYSPRFRGRVSPILLTREGMKRKGPARYTGGIR